MKKKATKSVKRSSKLQPKQTKMTAFTNCLHTSVSVHFGGHATHSRQHIDVYYIPTMVGVSLRAMNDFVPQTST